MRKILLILITGLLWCNVGMASEAGGVREPGHDQKCFEKYEKKKYFLIKQDIFKLLIAP